MIVRGKISKSLIQGPFSKAAVDVARKKVALDGELHVDCAEELIAEGSASADVWGVNIYLDGHLDFISLINIRPDRGNRTMELQDEKLRAAIQEIVESIFE